LSERTVIAAGVIEMGRRVLLFEGAHRGLSVLGAALAGRAIVFRHLARNEVELRLTRTRLERVLRAVGMERASVRVPRPLWYRVVGREGPVSGKVCVGTPGGVKIAGPQKDLLS